MGAGDLGGTRQLAPDRSLLSRGRPAAAAALTLSVAVTRPTLLAWILVGVPPTAARLTLTAATPVFLAVCHQQSPFFGFRLRVATR